MSKIMVESNAYEEWVTTLTTPQLRALCCQSGIVGWNARKRPGLLNLLKADIDGKARRIYEENYGVAG